MRRTNALDRVVLSVLGAALIGASAVGLAISVGALGDDQESPILDGDLRGWVERNEAWFWPVVAMVCALVGLLALAWLLRQVRIVHSPRTFDLPALDAGSLTLASTALADAIHADLTAHPAIQDATVHVLATDPATVDATVSVHDTADMGDVHAHVDQVLARVENAVGAGGRAGRVTIQLIPTPRVTA